MSLLVPQETKEEILSSLQDDEHGLWMYQQLHVKSSDVNFTWKTDMLMHRILTMAWESETEADFVQAIQYWDNSRGTDVLYQSCKHAIHEVFEQVQKWRQEEECEKR